MFTATRTGHLCWHTHCQCHQRSFQRLRDGRGNGGSAGHRKTERSDRRSKTTKAEGDGATGAASSPLVFLSPPRVASTQRGHELTPGRFEQTSTGCSVPDGDNRLPRINPSFWSFDGRICSIESGRRRDNPLRRSALYRDQTVDRRRPRFASKARPR